jgi:soluble epoxide hydrolase/lipid-phosphate phosphatase
VWRIVLFCPGLVSHVFSVCSPYIPPQKTYTPVKEVVETKLPFFRYQLQLMVTEVQENVKTLEQMKQFFKAMYGGRGPNGEDGFDPNKGILIENLPKLGNSPLLKPEVLDYYAESYMGNGIGPTCKSLPLTLIIQS